MEQYYEAKRINALESENAALKKQLATAQSDARNYHARVLEVTAERDKYKRALELACEPCADGSCPSPVMPSCEQCCLDRAKEGK